MLTENHHLKHKRKITLIYWSCVPVFLILSQLLFYYLNPNCICWSFYRQHRWDKVAIYLSTALLMYGSIFLVIKFLSNTIDKRSSLNTTLLLRYGITTVVVALCMFIFVYAERYLYNMLVVNENSPTAQAELVTRSYLVVNMVIAIFINSFYNSYMFFYNWRNTMEETNRLNDFSHELKEIALRAELKALKLQLDPHFMFNNFSILTHLINTNRDDARLFLANLSKVYRYVLASSKSDIVTIHEELEFVKHYFHLIKIRHGESTNITIDICETNKTMGIPPVTLQLLIENAIKHNIATVKKPLEIIISDSHDGYLSVKNNLQRINTENTVSGMGLKNIVERYTLFSVDKPEITESEHEFEVRLPFLEF